ncbi:hypothetical protein TNCV_1129151 [Trichonephila clavipes]|nr:hypothetical protein TNCV_1129151 [Trichonephila clavipes]
MPVKEFKSNHCSTYGLELVAESKTYREEGLMHVKPVETQYPLVGVVVRKGGSSSNVNQIQNYELEAGFVNRSESWGVCGMSIKRRIDLPAPLRGLEHHFLDADGVIATGMDSFNLIFLLFENFNKFCSDQSITLWCTEKALLLTPRFMADMTLFFGEPCKEVAKESMKMAAVEEYSSSPDNLLTVSGDGTWKTREDIHR